MSMMEGKYKVLATSDLMLKMDGLFSGPGSSPSTTERPPAASRDNTAKKPTMALVILPWMPLWIALQDSPIAAVYAALATLASVSSPDSNGSTAAMNTSPSRWLPLRRGGRGRYFCGGFSAPHLSRLRRHWLISCLDPYRSPRTTRKGAYGGDEALGNALFVKTNRIITAVWGVFSPRHRRLDDFPARHAARALVRRRQFGSAPCSAEYGRPGSRNGILHVPAARRTP